MLVNVFESAGRNMLKVRLVNDVTFLFKLINDGLHINRVPDNDCISHQR